MDFLLRNKETRNNTPVQLVKFTHNEAGKITSAEIDETAFQEQISKSRNRQILFVDVIGQSQVGKTTAIKCITRNNGHLIGDGIAEETVGVTIDGPYEIEELITGYGMQSSLSFNKASPHVYFLDIEGYGAFSKGQNYESVIKIYQKFAVPFVGISSVHIVLVTEKEGQQSFETITETLQLSDLCANSNAFSSAKIAVGVTRVQKRPFGRNFDNPDRETSNAIARKFTETFRANNFLRDTSYIVRPMPYIDPCEPDEKEIARFVPAFDLFVEDIFKLMECTLQSAHIRDYEATLEHFRRVRSSIDNMSGVKQAFEESLVTQGELTIQRQISFAITEAMKTANEKLKEAFQRALGTNDRIKLNEEIENIKAQMNEDIDSYLPFGLRGSKALFEAKKQIVAEFDELCSEKNSELLLRLTPSTLTQASTFGYQEIAKQREVLRNQLNDKTNLTKTLQNRNGVIDQISKVVLNATKHFIGETLGDNLAGLQEPINQVLETIRTTLVAELNSQLDQAVSKFTVHNSDFEYERDQVDERYVNVYQITTEINPEGHETKKRTFVCRSFEKPEPGFIEKISTILIQALPIIITAFKAFSQK